MVISNTVVNAIQSVWQIIGSDCISCAQENGEEMTNAAAIETCIDADRLTTNGFKSADDEICVLIQKNGYPTVMKALLRIIKLV